MSKLIIEHGWHSFKVSTDDMYIIADALEAALEYVKGEKLSGENVARLKTDITKALNTVNSYRRLQG